MVTQTMQSANASVALDLMAWPDGFADKDRVQVFQSLSCSANKIATNPGFVKRRVEFIYEMTLFLLNIFKRDLQEKKASSVISCSHLCPLSRRTKKFDTSYLHSS